MKRFSMFLPRVLPAALAVLVAFAATAVADDVVRVGFKEGKAPFVIASSPYSEADYDLDRPLGIEIEIFKEALAQAGMKIEPLYMNYKRMASQIAAGKIDAGATLQPGQEGVFYAEGYLRLEDHAVYQAGKGLEIKSFADMKGLRVVSFQNATKFLGDEYRAAVGTFGSYREIADQEKQVQMLSAGRADVIVLDISIFRYFEKRHAKPGQAFESAALFGEPWYFAAGFKAEALRDAFAKGLQALKDSGRYEEIYEAYTR